MSEARGVRPAGRVVGLWRYPVKSMGGEELAEVEVSWHGFAGDRRWAFVRDDVVGSGFPWLTLRQREAMSRYRPSFAEPARPDQSPTHVRAPSGTVYDVADPAVPAQPRGGGAEDVPFVEDDWVGCVLAIGGLRMRVDKRDGRCVVITIDPVTTERNPAILRAVASDRQGCLGVYGSTVEPGRVALNDSVIFETPA